MTISSQTRKAGPFLGNGSTVTFPFSFKVFAAGDLQVVRANSAGVESTLVLNSDYTVALNANQNSNPGGSITLSATLATGFKLVITSKIDYLQPTDLTNQGGFYPKVINDSLDRLTMLAQQLKEQVDRSAKLPITSTSDANALLDDISRLADSADNIDTVAQNIDAVGDAYQNATDAAVSASLANDWATKTSGPVAGGEYSAKYNAQQAASYASAAQGAASSSVASAASAVRYQGPSASNPTTRLDGSPIQQGDTYFNTVALENRVYNGTTWQPQAASPDTLTERSFLATAGQTTYTFAGGYRVNATYVWVNGVMLYSNEFTATDGTTITFGAPLALNDEVRVLSLKAVGSIVADDIGGLQAALDANRGFSAAKAFYFSSF